MLEEDYFVIGNIVNTQGVKGEVRVMPTTDDINRFKKLKEISIFKLGVNKSNSILDTKTLAIQSVRFHKKFVLIKFDGIDDMNEAEKLRNYEIRISKDLAIKCEKDEYFISDLYDMNVFTDEGEFLGILDDIIFTGANDVYVVKRDLDNIEGSEEASKNIEKENDIRKNIRKDVGKDVRKKVEKEKEKNLKEVLIPAIKQCILDVDIINNKMTVHLLEGLI